MWVALFHGNLSDLEESNDDSSNEVGVGQQYSTTNRVNSVFEINKSKIKKIKK